MHNDRTTGHGDEIQAFLRPTSTLDCGHPDVERATKDLILKCKDDTEKAVQLFYFVRDEIRYSPYMISVFLEDFTASRVLEWKKGYCVQKAVLLAAMGRAAGIPSRLVFAKIKNHLMPQHVLDLTKSNILPRHGYTQFLLNGRWINLAPTFDKALSEKNDLPLVEFDGENHAVLPSLNRKGEPWIEYLEKFPFYADLPFDWIVEKTSQLVGKDKRSWLNRPSA
ncbi:transglutaminase-like domain-containing protein [Desulfatiglans anilini]|uniref:transglutaminase-like domain-containing protein n=1 Tax=Desulfatiglans anilini TaxID=90728 RepID=UPI0004269368|nr:transglutaminase family protein [Desulfatiglans anilini]